MPYPSYEESVACLDDRRLGKQRLECRQIIDALGGAGSKSLLSHPVVGMWKGHAFQLACYAITCCEEWRRRGFADQMLDEFKTIVLVRVPAGSPPWLGNSELHSTMRGNLLRKDPEFYKRYGWSEKPMAGYFWPGRGFVPSKAGKD